MYRKEWSKFMLKDFSKETFDIFIQAGQSNSEGFGVGAAKQPYVPDDRVWYLNSDFTITPAAESVMGNETVSNFSLSFARKYLEADMLAEGRKLLILRCGVGGAGFLDNHWKLTDDCYLRMMEMIRTALALNQENRLVGLLWHQGETDATLKATYDVHYGHLLGLLQSVRNEFHVPELPFIAGDFVHHWKGENEAICRPVIEAIRAVCDNCGHGAFVETDGLLSNLQELGRSTQCGMDMVQDNIHFSRNSLYILGERYFRAYMNIISIT